MAPPRKTIEPKSRTQLWKETVMGGVLFVFGLALVWQFTAHTDHGHAIDRALLWVGVGSVATGLWMTNKKLATEWLAELRKFVPFAGGGDDAA